ncbi:MAG: LOG family protein, partial [Terracidiphilus sp.]|nr:LOG family protein [Terracidiphilus sp.]
GTLDELMEALTWAQIGLIAKPCILINTANYWDGLLTFLDTAVVNGFIEARNRELVRVAANAAEALAMAGA